MEVKAIYLDLSAKLIKPVHNIQKYIDSIEEAYYIDGMFKIVYS